MQNLSIVVTAKVQPEEGYEVTDLDEVNQVVRAELEEVARRFNVDLISLDVTVQQVEEAPATADA